MTWPTGSIPTANLDAATDSPALARADLLALAQAVNLMIGHGGALPGEIKAYGGTTLPTGYLRCDGSAVSRTTYADLFAAIGTTWGAGNGTTTFNVPDLIDRTLVGSYPGGTQSLRMAGIFTGNLTSGSNTITSVSTIVGVGRGMTLVHPNIPAGTTVTQVTANTITMSANASASATGASIAAQSLNGVTVGSVGGTHAVNQTTTELPPHTHNITGTNVSAVAGGAGNGLFNNSANLPLVTQSTGVGAALGVVQPSAVVAFIIKT